MIFTLDKPAGVVARTLTWLCLLGSALWPAHVAHAQEEVSSLERRVKAAFMFKFASYVEWPEAVLPQPGTPLSVAVVGDDELANELTQIAAGRAVDGRSIAVKKTRDIAAIADAHMLYVARAETARIPQIAKIARGRPLLIVTDSPGALSQGSIINFMLVQQRVKFEISLEEAERHSLKLSSRLLSVAHNVQRPAP
jgi:hypothetical protein